jgi:hypothetical protein
MTRLQELKEFIQCDDRLVPRGSHWFELYILGSDLIQLNGGRKFPKHLRRGASLTKKRARLIEQIECANQYQFLDVIDKFLRNPKIGWEKESLEKKRAGDDKDSEINQKIHSYKDKNKKLFSLLQYVRSDEKVFPKSSEWTKIYKLGTKKQKELRLAERFPSPLILAVYHASSEKDKQLRFIEQIEYAQKNGFLDEVENCIRAIESFDWEYAEEDYDDFEELHELRKERIFDHNITTLINSFSKILELEKNLNNDFNNQPTFCIYIKNLYERYISSSIKTYIKENQYKLDKLNEFFEGSEKTSKEYIELDSVSNIHNCDALELQIAKLKIVYVIQQIDRRIYPEWFGIKFWNLLVEKNICHEDFC